MQILLIVIEINWEASRKTQVNAEVNIINIDCVNILQELKKQKTSMVCDAEGVDRVMCYEVYYYTFNFKPEIFVEEKTKN